MGEKSLSSRVIGFVGSIVLTLCTFFLVLYPETFHLKTSTTLLIILIFALFQAILQCICFMHLWKEKGLPWNTVMFISTIAMAFVILFFSVWIMDHLNYNMMPGMTHGSHH